VFGGLRDQCQILDTLAGGDVELVCVNDPGESFSGGLPPRSFFKEVVVLRE
jgi:hypothetical protein